MHFISRMDFPTPHVSVEGHKSGSLGPVEFASLQNHSMVSKGFIHCAFKNVLEYINNDIQMLGLMIKGVFVSCKSRSGIYTKERRSS